MINIPNFIRRSFLKRALVLLLCIMMAAFACGCAGDGEETEDEPIALPTSAPEPQPVAGGELKLPMPTNADRLNPLSVSTEEMLGLFSLIFEGLVSVDSSGRIIAELAETWSVDETGYVWTLNLRGGVRWHGVEDRLTAQDVKYTYDRLVSMESSYYSAQTDAIETLAAVDDSTVTVTMNRKGYAALYALTFPIMYRSSASHDVPIGTGPYTVSRVTEERMELAANENWWRQRPYIDKISFYERDNNETALASYEASQLNMVPTSSVSAGKYREEGATNVLDMLTQTAELLICNMDNAILRDVRIRKALAYAIDRSRIISNVYMSRAQACDVPIAPDSWLYDSKSKLYDTDIGKAVSLLDEAGYSDIDDDGKIEYDDRVYNELEFTLLVSESTDTVRGEAAGLIASQLGELGITVNIETARYDIGDAESEYLKRLEEGDFDMALAGISLSRSANLSPLIKPAGVRNYSGYSSAALSELVDEMNSAADEAACRDAASRFQLQFAEELPFIVLYFRLNSIVYSADIKGLANVREPDIFQNVEKWYINANDD